MQFYSDPSREQETHALPDCEVFEVTYSQFICATSDTWMYERLHADMDDGFPNTQAAAGLSGFYWWSCLPGCLPDGRPNGPFDTEALAIADARESAGVS